MKESDIKELGGVTLPKQDLGFNAFISFHLNLSRFGFISDFRHSEL
jgi:hypothetical protein